MLMGMDVTVLVAGALLLAAGVVAGAIAGYRMAARRIDRGPELAALIGPAADTMRRVEGALHDVERDRIDAYAALREQVSALHRASTELGAQTRTLAGALRSPQVRGRWGEVQLQRIVELAGMTEHCDFETQVTTADGQRPDLIVSLPGGRGIPIDAKVPLEAFLEAAECQDEQRRRSLLVQHARSLRHHIDTLASKAYWRALQPAPEFVVLFVPGDALLDAALSASPGLSDYAFERHVIIATPSTLIALLRTVAFGWRQDRLSASAEQILTLGRELYHRLVATNGHLDQLGRNLQRAVAAYNSAISAIESRVLVSARRIADLGVTSERLPHLEPLTVAVRDPRLGDPGETGPPASGQDDWEAGDGQNALGRAAR
jgi:DNA recombination protein RmuC